MLFSGGKDSVFAIHETQKLGHSVKCLVTVRTHSPESHLLHHPNLELTKIQARSLNIPQILIDSTSDHVEDEINSIKRALHKAKNSYNVEGVAHGGIASQFQKTKFENAASMLDLNMVSPLWKKDQKQYLKQLIDNQFEFIITSVSCDGLDDSWLGKKITTENLDLLIQKSEKYKFNLAFEGGEAETFVVNCPLFSSSIEIIDYHKYWDGYRGRFEITRAETKHNA